jgi:hypothetical protein
MEKEFIPYEQALALKELGFDEPCLAFFWNTGKFYTTAEYPHSIETHKQNQLGDYNYDSTSAPLYQQAFRWFREKYKISGEISSDYYLEGKDNEWEYNIYQLGKEDDGYVGTIPIFKTPEEAELECLKKLIEIVNGNQS